MKKRLLIICSIIGVLLAGFQFPIYAETTPPDYSSSTSIMSSSPLDQYFYDNYELLPYIESNDLQYLDSGVLGNSNLRIDAYFSNLDYYGSRSGGNLFGVTDNNLNQYFYTVNTSQNYKRFGFGSSNYDYSFEFADYSIYHVVLDKNLCYLNDTLIHTFNEEDFNIDYSIYIFANNNSGTNNRPCKAKLYSFSIYDYSANDGEGALIRDYYPARSKSGGIIGLYDAVNKTFITSLSSNPFNSPDGDPVNLSLGANITQFLSGSLSWIGAIFEGINEMPIIWVFIAIALAGVAFRWARRIVHF